MQRDDSSLIERSFAPSPNSVPEARRYLAALLNNVASDVVDSAKLIVTELAANAVRHAGTDFTIRVVELDDQIVVEVIDGNRGVPTMRHPDVNESGGRGLEIVNALASSWGVSFSNDNSRKTVWAKLERTA